LSLSLIFKMAPVVTTTTSRSSGNAKRRLEDAENDETTAVPTTTSTSVLQEQNKRQRTADTHDHDPGSLLPRQNPNSPNKENPGANSLVSCSNSQSQYNIQNNLISMFLLNTKRDLKQFPKK
jgi:hypothetical protein